MAPTDKPWRVYGARGISTDHQTKRAAYYAVEALRKEGVPVRVYHWEGHTWQLYEKFPAPDGGVR